MRMTRWFRPAFQVGSMLILSACSGGTNVNVSWTAKCEAAVNRSGGGYRVYYGKTPGFALSGASSVNVPFQSGSTAPTTARLNLSSGTYYVKVVAYSSLVGPSGTASTSAPSLEMPVVVP